MQHLLIPRSTARVRGFLRGFLNQDLIEKSAGAVLRAFTYQRSGLKSQCDCHWFLNENLITGDIKLHVQRIIGDYFEHFKCDHRLRNIVVRN